MGIKYDRLWNTMKEKKVSQYELISRYNLSASIIHRLKTNDIVKTSTLETLCRILDCRIEDICEYIPDNSKE